MKKFTLSVIFLLIVTFMAQSQTLRMNCGLGGTVSYGGATFVAEVPDYYVQTAGIAGTTAPGLPSIFLTERWGEFDYNLPVDYPGNYILKLHFTESWFGDNGPAANPDGGQREFDIVLNGDTLARDFDIYLESGGTNIPLTVEYDSLYLEAGTASIEFIRRINNAQICAIQLISKPIIQVVEETTEICPGDTLTLDAGADYPGFLWNTGATTRTIKVTSAGNYRVRVTSAEGVVDTSLLTVISERPAPVIDLSYTDVSCNGLSDAEAFASVSSGTEPYTYNWSTGADADTLEALPADTYSLLVEDFYGCTDSVSFEIVEPDSILAEIELTEILCAGAMNGAATVSASGGTGELSYTWNGTPGGATIDGLSAGDFTLLITDDNLCQVELEFELPEPAPIEVNATVTNILCAGDEDGAISLDISGGLAPYDFLWNSGDTLQDLIGLEGGTYMVTVIDSNLCSETFMIDVEEPAPLELTLSSTPDNGSGDGTASVVVTGGVEPYEFAWNDPANQDEATANGLSSGSYTVIVTDANDCISAESVMVDINTSIQSLAIQAFLNIYPNPVSERLNIAFETEQSGLSDIRVMDINGRICMVQQLILSPGNNTLSMDAAALSTGIYTIHVSVSDKILAIGRFIVE